MDEVAAYNQSRWEALGRVGAVWTRPWLDLTPEIARARADEDGPLGDLAGRDVLCLASGGGQQSAMFAVLGANVTVVDLSPSQLERDNQAARHYGAKIRTLQGDMRDLSALEPSSFDFVFHPYSINFVPEFRRVVTEVARVCRPGAVYDVMTANPFLMGVGTHAWNGRAYELTAPYVEGAVIEYPDEAWVARGSKGEVPKPPREYRHTLGTILGGLADEGFVIRAVREYTRNEADAAPGSWDHLLSIAPVWFMFRAVFEPQP